MTRRIIAHKGGRTARAPEARMTPQERGRLDAVLARRGVKYIDWYIGHVNADYKQITGGNEMAEPFTSKDELAALRATVAEQARQLEEARDTLIAIMQHLPISNDEYNTLHQARQKVDAWLAANPAPATQEA